MTPGIDPVPIGRPSFLDSPRCIDLDLLAADVAILGVPYTTPVDLPGTRAPSSDAPAAVRDRSWEFAGEIGHYDFEFGGDLAAGRRVRIADCGDASGRPGRYDENGRSATAAVRRILECGALPVVLGGDAAAVIPALRAFAGRGPICAVHLGAGLDWRDEVNGVRDGAPSAMRRASELSWVASMIQVGLRGAGSARREDVADAAAFGSVMVRAEEVHREGVEAVLRRLPDAAGYFVSLDAGALDPGIAPGVAIPAFGGLSYFETTNLLKGVAAGGRVAGCALTGIAPAADVKGITGLLGARLLLNLLGALAHAGQIGEALDGPAPLSATSERPATTPTRQPAGV